MYSGQGIETYPGGKGAGLAVGVGGGVQPRFKSTVELGPVSGTTLEVWGESSAVAGWLA